MPTDSQGLKDYLLQADEEFRDLSGQHHELEIRLHDLLTKPYLSDTEQFEEVTIKKRKLQLKDRMEDIIRRHRRARRDARRRTSTDIVVLFCERTRPSPTCPLAVFLGPCRAATVPRALCASILPASRSSPARSLPASACVLARRPRLACRSRPLAGFMAFFFRDPERIALRGDHLVLSPADGRVMVAGEPEPGVAPAGRRGSRSASSCRRSTCTSTACRSPAASSHVEYRPGQVPARLPARGGRPRTSAARSGSDQGDRTVVARQIVGILARRVVCRAVAGHGGPGGRPVRPDEVRLADGRVRAAATRNSTCGSATACAAAETVLARFPRGEVTR